MSAAKHTPGPWTAVDLRHQKGRHVTITRMVEIEVECIVAVEPGEAETPRTFDCGGVPATPASAELIEVRLEGSCISADILSRGEIEAIEAQAVEEYEESEAEGPDPDDENDRRRDMRDDDY